MLERYVDSVASVFQPHTVPAKEDLVAIIKDSEYFDVNPAKGQMVSDHLAGDIWVVYAVDLPTATQSLNESTLKEMKIDRAELRSLAISNLRRIMPPVQRYGDGPWYVMLAGSDYAASLLLLDEIWDEMKESVDGDIVAAVPARDIALFTGSSSKEGIQILRQKARDIHEGGDQVISQALLRLTDAGWKAFEVRDPVPTVRVRSLVSKHMVFKRALQGLRTEGRIPPTQINHPPPCTNRGHML